MKTKRITCAILCLIMVFAMLPTAALADSGTGIWVDGTEVEAGKYYVNDAGGIAEASSTNYNVYYDIASNTLTLKNANIKKNHVQESVGAAIYASGSLTVKLEGNSSVSGETNSQSMGIYSAGTLTIAGNGSLTATGGEVVMGISCGVTGDSVNITGGTVTAKGGKVTAGLSCGVLCKSFTIAGNGSLTATGGDAMGESYGVYGMVSVNVNGGTVKATGGTVNGGKSYGMYGVSVTIGNGTVEATGGAVAINTGTASDTYCASYGVRGSTGVLIKGGKVKATGGTVTVTGGNGTKGESFGVSGDSIIMEGGEVTAKGGNASGAATDIGNINISGSSYGVLGNTSVNIAGGRLIATGGAAAATDNEDSGSISTGVYGFDITIADGVIEAAGGKTTNGSSHGVFGNYVVITGGTATATGGEANDAYSRGIWGYISITISGGTVTATGGAAGLASNGMSGGNEKKNCKFTISGGTVKATGGVTSNSPGTSYGVYGDILEITGGKVTAKGGRVAAGYSFGVCSDVSVEITGGTVTATGGGSSSTLPSLSFGVYGISVLIEKDSTVTAAGGDINKGTSYGVYGGDSIEITGGTVSADGGASNGNSYGMEGYNSVDISGGKVTAKGDSAAISLNSEATLAIFSGYTAPHTITVSVNKSGHPAVIPADNLGAYKYLRIAPYSRPIDPQPEITLGNDPSSGNSTIRLSGAGLSAGDQLITRRNPSGSEYSAMLKLADSDDVFATYDIHLKSGNKSTGGAANLTFDLNEKYSGQAFTLVHKKADGTYEYFYATADANGDLTFGPLFELSPFMLVKGTLNANVPGVPDTGGSSTPALWLGAALMACAVIAAVIVLFVKRRSD